MPDAIGGTGEAETGGWLQARGQVGGQPGLSNKFQASQSDLPRHYRKRTNKNKRKQLPRTQGLKVVDENA